MEKDIKNVQVGDLISCGTSWIHYVTHVVNNDIRVLEIEDGKVTGYHTIALGWYFPYIDNIQIHHIN
jgi:hypothetical protein